MRLHAPGGCGSGSDSGAAAGIGSNASACSTVSPVMRTGAVNASPPFAPAATPTLSPTLTSTLPSATPHVNIGSGGAAFFPRLTGCGGLRRRPASEAGDWSHTLDIFDLGSGNLGTPARQHLPVEAARGWGGASLARSGSGHFSFALGVPPWHGPPRRHAGAEGRVSDHLKFGFDPLYIEDPLRLDNNVRPRPRLPVFTIPVGALSSGSLHMPGGGPLPTFRQIPLGVQRGASCAV
jgi:hypothetical protein